MMQINPTINAGEGAINQRQGGKGVFYLSVLFVYLFYRPPLAMRPLPPTVACDPCAATHPHHPPLPYFCKVSSPHNRNPPLPEPRNTSGRPPQGWAVGFWAVTCGWGGSPTAAVRPPSPSPGEHLPLNRWTRWLFIPPHDADPIHLRRGGGEGGREGPFQLPNKR